MSDLVNPKLVLMALCGPERRAGSTHSALHDLIPYGRQAGLLVSSVDKGVLGRVIGFAMLHQGCYLDIADSEVNKCRDLGVLLVACKGPFRFD